MSAEGYKLDCARCGGSHRDIDCPTAHSEMNLVRKKVSYGSMVDALLDDAFSVLQHDTGERDPEWHSLRAWLAQKFKKTLRRKL